MATLDQLRSHLGTLSAVLWNFGASFPVPTLDEYDDGELGFAFTAELPGASTPRAATIGLAEIWRPRAAMSFRLAEYEYDFIEFPLERRQAFHRHDETHFLAEFGVAVHEHCEEQLGRPSCSHYFGLPLDAYEAIRRFTARWGQPGPIGCAQLRCMA